MRIKYRIGLFAAATGAALLIGPVMAEEFSIPGGDLEAALDSYTKVTGVTVIYSGDAIRSVKTKGAKGELSPDAALTEILSGTGFVSHHNANSAITLVRTQPSENMDSSVRPLQLAAGQATPASLETVTVTSSKIGGDVQNIPISITALSQEQLTATQTAGGPDLVKQVPNMSFTKTNFSGYSIQLRGIGTQAISVTTDPAVAVAFNDTPFIRNHFFEQEFYDVSQVEVLRGPQGTLYGRNATAGVVNLVSAKPTDQFEAMASADIGNYGNRRLEGMINVPIVDDRLDLRIAGEWTKRQGYSFNELTDSRIDGRDLWSGRVSIGWKPFENVQTNLVWEHFSEDDDRMRTAKQLCETMPRPATVGGVPVPTHGGLVYLGDSIGAGYDVFSQGCQMTSLYAPSAFELPEPFSLQYIQILGLGARSSGVAPYEDTTQSQNLRVIESASNPVYKAKNDTVELNSDYAITPTLTLTSQAGFNQDFLSSTEDYNRFNSSPGVFANFGPADTIVSTNGTFCDPQVGCSNRLVAQDLSDEHASQLSQEFRLASNFSGPFNFSFGGNFLHYETEENYYVFINSLTLTAIDFYSGNLYGSNSGLSWTPGPFLWTPGVSDSSGCLPNGTGYSSPSRPTSAANGCVYIDPNPITSPNNEGHNYFLSQNPYTLNSYAGFGEVYYNVTSDLKLTGGLRWTDDRKHFVDIPSELLVSGYGYTSTGVVNQQWDQFTGRAVANWTPKLDFTDQTLIYGSYSHGYKAGGANPPGAVLLTFSSGDVANPIHPLTFKPEFIDAYELGTKNTALDGSLTFNGDVFFYNYKGYQISEIVDRSAINLNFNATVKGAELEALYEPLPGLRFNFAGGYEATRLANGSQAVDLMDRTAGNPNWMAIKPYPTQATNCIMPIYVVAREISYTPSDSNPTPLPGGSIAADVQNDCIAAYQNHDDPITCAPYMANPSGAVPAPYPIGSCPTDTGISGNLAPGAYPGFDPLAGTPGDPYTGQNTYKGVDYGPAPNNGQGFDKNLSGNQLPNAPPFTVSFGTQYTLPISPDWAGTLRGDYYWQDYSWARVFNDNPYDRLRGYTNINLTLIFTNQNGWQVMFYDKNIFNVTDITGAFLNSDDSGLTTNVFMTDPKLIGIRVTKNW